LADLSITINIAAPRPRGCARSLYVAYCPWLDMCGW